jgi:hypothetical protein
MGREEHTEVQPGGVFDPVAVTTWTVSNVMTLHEGKRNADLVVYRKLYARVPQGSNIPSSRGQNRLRNLFVEVDSHDID